MSTSDELLAAELLCEDLFHDKTPVFIDGEFEWNLGTDPSTRGFSDKTEREAANGGTIVVVFKPGSSRLDEITSCVGKYVRLRHIQCRDMKRTDLYLLRDVETIQPRWIYKLVLERAPCFVRGTNWNSYYVHSSTKEYKLRPGIIGDQQIFWEDHQLIGSQTPSLETVNAKVDAVYKWMKVAIHHPTTPLVGAMPQRLAEEFEALASKGTKRKRDSPPLEEDESKEGL